MPYKELISKKMAEFLSAISHPHRIRIIEELKSSEKDVNSLQLILKISQSSVSQHLSILRSQKAVKKRKVANHAYYSLTQDALSDWLLSGLNYVEGGFKSGDKIRNDVSEARQVWQNDKPS